MITGTPIVVLSDKLQSHEFTNADAAAENLSIVVPALSLLTGIDQNARLKIKLHSQDQESPLTFQVMSVTVPSGVKQLYESIPATEAWKPARLLAAFHADPSAASLAETLRAIHAASVEKAFRQLTTFMPWPLFAAMRQVDMGVSSLTDLADQAEAGDFGDLAAWREAEQRWSAQGVTEDDLRHLVNWGITAEIGNLGAPHPSGVSMSHGVEPPHKWQLILTELLQTGDATMSRLFRWLVDFSVETYPPPEPFEAAMAHHLIGRDDESWIRPGLVAKFSPAAQSDATTQELLSRKAILGRIFSTTERGSGSVRVDPSLIANSGANPGLLPFFLNLWGSRCREHEALVAAAKTHMSHADPRVAAAATALSIIASDTDVGELAIPMQEPQPRFGLYHVMNALSSDVFRFEAALKLANALVTGLAEDASDGYDRAYQQLSRFADQRRSELGRDECFNKLELRGSLCGLPAET